MLNLWNFSFPESTPARDLTARYLFELIKQAVHDGALTAGQKVRSWTADAVASLLVERR